MAHEQPSYSTIFALSLRPCSVQARIVSQGHLNVHHDANQTGAIDRRLAASAARPAHIALRFRTLYRLVDLPTMDRHLLRSVESESHFVAPDVDHCNDDIVIDYDALVLFPR